MYASLIASNPQVCLIGPQGTDVLHMWKDITVLVSSAMVATTLAARLAAHHPIETRRPLHRMTAHADLDATALPESDAIADRLISLPISSEVLASTVEFVAGVLLDDVEAAEGTS